jgi:hypothetical protein
MLHEYQKKKEEEEKMVKEYEQGDLNIKEQLYNLKKEEAEKLNIKFFKETTNITNSVTSSIKYLLKKRNKDKQTKKEDGFVDINNIEVNNHNSYNNIEIPKAKKQSKRKVVKDKVEYNDIETELFAID